MSAATAEAAAQLALALLDVIDPAAEVAYRQALAREAWSQGYAAAIADVKAVQHEAVRAIRAEPAIAPGGGAWLAAVERHGGTEFGGIGQPRVPVAAPVLAEAKRQQGRTAR